MGRFLPVDVGLRLIMLVGDLVSADRSRVACNAVHAALSGNVVIGELATSWRRFSGRPRWPVSHRFRWPDSEHFG
jgi:hypothetical protein